MRIYLLERPLDPAFLAPPLRLRDLEAPADRDLLALRAEDFRPPALGAPAFFLPPDRALAFFPAEAFRAPDFFTPEDLVDLLLRLWGVVEAPCVGAGRLALVHPVVADSCREPKPEWSANPSTAATAHRHARRSAHTGR